MLAYPMIANAFYLQHFNSMGISQNDEIILLKLIKSF